MRDARGNADRPIVYAILLGGVIAGTLDITYAFCHYGLGLGMTPMRVLQSVAAGALGRDAAVSGGWPTALLGLGFHFLIATTMAAFFVTVTRRVPALNRRPVLAGLVYGLGLYVVMTFGVLPLSRAGDGTVHLPKLTQYFFGALVTHTLFVGVPIALVARSVSSRERHPIE
jgi:hypothetical protein